MIVCPEQFSKKGFFHCSFLAFRFYKIGKNERNPGYDNAAPL